MSFAAPPFGSGQVVRVILATASRVVRLVGFVFILALASTASAQDGVYYPGSVWTSNGTATPVEKGNIISRTHAEQGIAYRGMEVFGQHTFVADTKGNDWNRLYSNGIGGRFTQTISHGMVRASASFVRERRYDGAVTQQGLVILVESWIGWGNTAKPVKQ